MSDSVSLFLTALSDMTFFQGPWRRFVSDGMEESRDRVKKGAIGSRVGNEAGDPYVYHAWTSRDSFERRRCNEA